MLAFKIFRHNLLNIVTLLNLKVVLVYHPIRPKTISTILKSKLSKSTLVETGILLSQLSVHFQNKISLSLLIRFLVLYIIPDLKLMTRKGLMGYLPEISLTWKNPALFFSWPRQLELPEVQPLMTQTFPLGSCFIWILRLQCWNNPWIYLYFCGYMFCYFIPLWIHIQNQTTTSLHTQISCR